MARTEATEDTHVFYAVLKFGDSILADEKDKKKFLDFALGSLQGDGIGVMAFVVLDDALHFLIRGQGERGRGEGVSKMLDDCENFLKKAGLLLGEPKKSCGEIETTQVQRFCRYIHALPLESGCVEQMRDYWWSSYQTYRGGYQWPGLDASALLSFFSEDPVKGRMLFLRYHRRKSRRDAGPSGKQTGT